MQYMVFYIFPYSGLCSLSKIGFNFIYVLRLFCSHEWFHFFFYCIHILTVAARSKTSSLTRTLGSWVRILLRTWMFGVCMHLFCVRVVLCIGRGLRRADHSSKKSLRLWKITKLNKWPGPRIGWKSHWKGQMLSHDFFLQSINILACWPVARQRLWHKQIYSSRYWVTDSQTNMFPWKQLNSNRGMIFSMWSVPRCYRQDMSTV
jgi:hypothetical protein